MDTPQIRRLSIERFRGIESLVWKPGDGINVILGGGNTGKTTLLDAIALLLYPNTSFPITDTDYWQRITDTEFVIEAVFSLPADIQSVYQQYRMLWPWEWDGENAVLPQLDENPNSVREPVFKARARGTADLEVIYEWVQPNGEVLPFSNAIRRAIGLVRLSGDDRNERDLRLIQGSGLDRLLADKTLRGRLFQRFSNTEIAKDLKEESKQALTMLDKSFVERALPGALGVGFTGGNNTSINALIGLTAEKDGTTLPLTSWGAGTRRLASLAIANTLQNNLPITVVDELERGLEPYRQRGLINELRGQKTQIFLTTHSATVLSATADASLWYLDAHGHLGDLSGKPIERQQQADPESLLARFLIVAEGITEVGFLEYLFDRYICNWRDQGLYITDRGGNENVVLLLEALTQGGLTFAGFADDEGTYAGKWSALKSKLGPLLFQWPDSCVESHLISLLNDNQLLALITDPVDEKTGYRLRILAERLEVKGDDKSFDTLQSIARSKFRDLKNTVIAAATGSVPNGTPDGLKKTWKNHGKAWFKSIEGGRELAEKMFTLNLWPQIRPQLLPFINAIRERASQPPLPDDQL